MNGSGESHETLSATSTLPGDGLTPEQGAGSREQGAGSRNARARATATLLGNSLLDEHRRQVRPSLPKDVARRTGEQIDSLLDDPEIDPEEIREGLRRLRANRRWGPGMLPNLVHEVRQEHAGQGGGVPAKPSRQQETDDLFAAAAARMEAREASQ